ncbi:V-type ATP synthase subunit E [Methanolapillus ohkumae]|uniref:A-type ATP synthase subunit E n=1 Tax=Methanolapillus ohkumae TaxID=3028298 RepID=A0AA96V873_9EURY|nr:V-type proton ATPase subunit E [Methanosarcinaceae archaeon Am2]
MGLEIVLNDITEGAKADVRRIGEEADAASLQIIGEARQASKEALGSRLLEVEEKLEQQRQQVLSSANLEVKRIVLNRRKALLDQVYDQALEKIKNMPADENEKYLKTLIKNHEKGGYKIYSNAKSEDIVKKLSKLEYGGNLDCIGGIVIENKEGNVRLDFTYDLMIKTVYDRSLKSISDILNG